MLCWILLTAALLLPAICGADKTTPHTGDNLPPTRDDAHVYSSKNEQLLSALLLPFRVRFYLERDVEELARVLWFMNERAGQCPRPTARELLRVKFGAASLERTYGVERLDALQLLAPDVVSNGDGMNANAERVGEMELILSPRDDSVRVYVSDIIFKRGEGKQRILQINVMSQSQRRLQRMRREKIEAYAKEVEATHATLRGVHYNEMIRDQQRRRRDFYERQRQFATMRQFEAFQREQKERAKHDYTTAFFEKRNTHADASSVRFAGRCRNIRHAIRTLQSQHVLPSERRMRYLRAKEKKVCGTTFVDMFYEDAGTCDSRCPSYCEGVDVLQRWAAHSGSSFSTAQLHALYHNILVNSPDFDDKMEDYILRIRELVLSDVHHGVFSTCSDLCQASTHLLSEMKFFAGVLDLLDDTALKEKGVVPAAWWDRARQAHLRIWEAAHVGSQRATAALATMKEHGVLSPRRSRVTAALLSSVLSERHLYFWKQVMGDPSKNFGDVTPSAQKLLRHERFFGLENSWSAVNEPHITRENVRVLRTEFDGVGGSETEDDEASDGMPAGVFRNLFMGHMYIAGTKGVPRDLKRAECLLLKVLRQLHYTCDVTHPEELDKTEFSKNDRGGACEEHLEELSVLRYTSVSMGPCTVNDTMDRVPNHPSLNFVTYSKKIYETVHDVLVLLAYIQLLNGLQHDAAARYSFLAVEVGAAAFHVARADMPAGAEQFFLRANSTTNVSPAMMKNRGWLPGELLAHALRRGEPRDSLFDFTRSGFLSPESLVILAVTLFRASAATRQNICMAAKHFFGTRSCVEKSGRASCHVQWSFFFLLEAARMGQDAATSPDILSRVYPSPRLADAPMLMVSLLKSGRVTLEDIREGDLFTSARYAFGGFSPFFPSEGDTCASYIAKLERLARRMSPFSVLGRQTAVHAKNWHSFITHEVSLREIHVLRAAMQSFLEGHDMNPLLVVSDMHDYLDTTRRSLWERFLEAVWDTVLLPFTLTQGEILVEQFAKEILPGSMQDTESVVIAERLAYSVFGSRPVRELSIAVQLLSIALVSGAPDGFTLILVEEMERHNSHLCSVAAFISEHVFGNLLTEVWMEEHKVSQWHYVRSGTKRWSATFSMNPRISFRYALWDSKMEFFAQVALKRAMSEEQRVAQGGDELAGKNFSALPKTYKKIIHHLALCSGVLIDISIRYGRPFPPRKPYDGMYFPVGSLLCLRRLLQYVRSTNISPFAGLSADDAELALLDMIAELALAQASYYDLSLGPFSAPTDGDGDGDEEREEEREELLRKFRKFLVEPWRRVNDGAGEQLHLPELGEGAYYNSRLHRVTGTYYAARLQRYYTRAERWLKRLAGVG